MNYRRGARLPLYLSLAYIFLVVYASLSPFSGWQDRGYSALAFLSAPWPHYFTWFDVVANFLAYLALGFLLGAARQARTSRAAAVLQATLLAITLSFAMEALQTYLPSRISSNLDLLCNSLGGLTGALLAAVSGRRIADGSRLVALRYDWFVAGHATDFALVVVALWLLSQFSPALPLFGSGEMNGIFPAAVALPSPRAFVFAEAAVVMFNLVCVGLLVAAVLRNRSAAAVTGLIFAALALKTAAGGLLSEAQTAWVWLTPGAIAGLIAGMLLLTPLLLLPPRAQIYCALAALPVAVAAINLMPENPYYAEYLQEFNLGQGRYVNFIKLTRLLSGLWPFLAFGSLLALLRGTRHGAR